MKRISVDISKSITFRNIEREYKLVKKSCTNENKLFHFSKNLNANLFDITNDLLNGTYKGSVYNIFLIREHKYRVIMSEEVRDKIVNNFISREVLMKVLEKKLIDQNVATRLNKGSKEAYMYFEKYIRAIGTNEEIYALKIDISKYFYSIDHETLKNMLRKEIKSGYALDLLFQIIDSTDCEYINNQIVNMKQKEIDRIKKLNISLKEKNNFINEINKLPMYEKAKGLPIGNVCSQILAIYFLNGVDKYIKEDLNCKYYVRYMDDMVILSKDKNHLIELFKKITKKVNEINLNINPKSDIFKLNNSFTFLGYTYHIQSGELKKRLKSTTYKKAVRRLNYLRTHDYKKYYLSKVSYNGLFMNELYSLYDEYNYLKDKYKKYVVIVPDLCICDTNNDFIKGIIGKRKLGLYVINEIITSLKRINYINFIVLRNNKVEFYQKVDVQ